ncbi:MAG: ATP-binding cassette domain-containing protein, partial [Candidatus Thorarchaeota archaeon]
MTECIQTEHLTKHYGKRRGIEDLNMTVPSGMVFCLAGPNGSGKTTTLKILSTLLRQSSGTAVVCGHDVNDDPVGVRRSISLLQQATVVDPYMTVREYLTVFCQMQNPEL